VPDLRAWRLALRLIAGAAATVSAALGPAVLAAPAENWSVPGLEKPAEIIVDHWGVPHIFAGSQRDAFFLQGYNAARDRLWQIDLWRKRGLGRLSASLGPAYLEQDRAARLLLYRGDMAAEWAAYGPEGRDIVSAFTAGVNAYVDQVHAGKRPLPVEFRLTGSAPERWAPEDVVRIRSHALVSNLVSEVQRAQTLCRYGFAAETLRRKLEPAHALQLAEGLDPCSVPAEVLTTYQLGTQPVSFHQGSVKTAALEDFDRAVTAEGSNNWVIDAAHSATGRPILANDPHRQLGAPSLRYLAHLSAPGLDIIGAGEPALPGVALGHNADAAFGLTIFYIDQEDLYVETTDAAHPDQTRSGEGWEPMRVVHESIPVKGAAPVDVTLKFTRHGPVLYENAGHAFALRSVWAEPGSAGYLQSLRFIHARTSADFLAARSRWAAPPLNLVWADRAGEIDWAAGGAAPVRPNWDGLAPVPGDGRYEWKGFWSASDLPSLHNPARGWVATANQMNLPVDYPAETRKLSFEWADRSRISRIEAVLGSKPKITLQDAERLQTDSVSPLARRAIALFGADADPQPRRAAAIALLRNWDGNETTDSAAAALYEVWAMKHLGPAMLKARAPGAAVQTSLDAVVTALEPLPADIREPVLRDSLDAALGELDTRLGPYMKAWRWGDLHHATFVPAVAALAGPELKAKMTAGPLPIPGGASTPKAATYDPKDFNTIAGASVRLVMDVGAWDNSRFINTPGQSGDPDSPHYKDLFEPWATGAYRPLLFSRPAVEAAADRIIKLTPQKP
jgi:penicillin G amidase